MAAGVVEGKEEAAAKEVREDGRNATHHQELEGGELPLVLHEGGGEVVVEVMEVVVLISTLVRARVCSRLLCICGHLKALVTDGPTESLG